MAEAGTINVEMPDGTVIQGVPEGPSKAELQAKLDKYSAPDRGWLGKILPPRSPAVQAASKDALERPWGSGVPQFAYDRGGDVTDIATKLGASPETAAKFGYGTNVALQAGPALLSGFKMAGVPEPSILEKPARGFMQSALKPSMPDLKTGAAGRAIGDMLEEGISPTQGGMSKASALADKMNELGAKSLAGSTADADVASVIQRLDPLRNKEAMQVNPESDIAAIDKAISEFKNSPAVSGQSSIPVQLAQKLKSGTYASLGNKAYGELGSSSTEAQKQLARGLREEVIAKVPELAAPLKREASLMNIQEVAAGRALQDANKNPLALGTSIAAIMHDPLAAAGMWANASTPVKAMIARMLFQSGKPSSALPAAIAAKEAANQQRE